MPTPAPSAHDRRLLEAIATLFQDNAGRAPTLSEIAVQLGQQPSSRANVQRRLVALSPTYVTIGAGARAIRLTATALAMLDAPAPDAREEPLSDDVLRLLASGLTWLASEQAEGRSPPVPYRDVWQRALNRLVCGGLERGVTALPSDAVAAAMLCHRPLREWPVRFALSQRYPDEKMLFDDEPTPFCRELAAPLSRGDAERELQERMILPVIDLCRMHRAPDAYVKFRSYLIEHPVVELIDLIGESLEPELGEVGQRLLELYEPVPESLRAADGRVLLCPVCGWTLARTARGTLSCGDQRCRDLSDGFQRVDSSMRYSPGLHRVRRAIRRYIVAPGRYEVDTAARLRKLKSRAGSLVVDLWPSFDAYDLRITFPDQHVWAVDIKDWAFPTLLARVLAELERDNDLAWNTAFYAIPDVRLKRRPDYLTVLAAATPGRGFELCTLDTLVSQARERLVRLGVGGGKETMDAQ